MPRKKIESILKLHLIILISIVLYIIFVNVTKIYCPIFFIIGKPCPTCGSTRAILSLLSFDFDDYFYYNATALPLGIFTLLGVHGKFVKKHFKYLDFFVILAAIISFLYYLFRIYNNLLVY